MSETEISRRALLKLTATTAVATLFHITPSSRTASEKNSLEEKITPYYLGDERINLRSLQKPGSPVTYFNMHDDENTAVEAAEQIIREYGGRLIELKNKGGTRNITFKLNGQQYQVDPNRIFTEKGIKEGLKEKYNETVGKKIEDFGIWLLNQYSEKEPKVMVTIHNNKDKGYGVQYYDKGGAYEKDAKKVSINKQDPDNFFFVTTEEHFNHFADKGFNVVLQDNEKVNDDGSLSVYCGKKGIPYINIEAQHGNLKEQIEMTKAVAEFYKSANHK